MLVDWEIDRAIDLIEQAPEGSSIALCQLDSRWIDVREEAVQELRSAIDACLYGRLVCDEARSLTVLRLLPYDPPSDVEPELHRRLVAEKRRWQADLFRQQSFFATPQGREAAEGLDRRRISIRFFVFGRAGQVDRLPDDCLEFAPPGSEIDGAFREAWMLPRVFGESRRFHAAPGLQDPERLLVDLGRATADFR